MKSIRDILLNPGRRDFEPPPYIDGLGRRPRLVYAAAVVVALAVAAWCGNTGPQGLCAASAAEARYQLVIRMMMFTETSLQFEMEDRWEAELGYFGDEEDSRVVQNPWIATSYINPKCGIHVVAVPMGYCSCVRLMAIQPIRRFYGRWLMDY